MQRFAKTLTPFAITLLSLWFGSMRPALASIDLVISPPLLEFEVGEKNRTQSLKISNFGSKPAKVKISVFNWRLDEKNSVELIPPTEQSLDQWMFINPIEFTLPAKGQQTVRFGIQPRVQPEPGEHRAIIYFDSVGEESAVASQGIAVKGRLGIAAYGYVGEPDRIGVLNGVTVDTQGRPRVLFDISSQGNANVRMRGQYAIWPAQQFPGAQQTKAIPNLDNLNAAQDLPKPILSAGSLISLPILPGTRRQVPLQLPEKLPPGNYVLDLNGELGKTTIDQSLPFVVTP